MKTKLKLKSLVIALLLLLILTNSCRHVYVINSEAKIVGRTIDTTLNDSVLIYGTVFDAGEKSLAIPGANIWIEGTDLSTKSDVHGEFSLEFPPGTYTVKCLYPHSDPRFTGVLDNISLSPNEKIEVKFFLGTTIE